jgi:hypothetical protein
MHYSFFDFEGHYLGCMDRSGRFFDPAGAEWGLLRDDRRVVDPNGEICGYVNAQGSFFEPDGTCRGYLRDADANPPPLVWIRCVGVALPPCGGEQMLQRD